MNLDDLFKIEPQEQIVMSKSDFFEKTKSVLNNIYSSYSQGWQSRVLKNDEYPEETICDKCTGRGIFINNDEEKECIQDYEYGTCFHRFCDYEQVGMCLEDHLNDMYELLLVDKIEQDEQRNIKI